MSVDDKQTNAIHDISRLSHGHTNRLAAVASRHAATSKKSPPRQITLTTEPGINDEVSTKIPIADMQEDRHEIAIDTNDVQPEIDDSILQEVSDGMQKPNNQRFSVKSPFIEHIYELRKRVIWCVLALIIGGVVGYFFQDRIIAFLVKPLGQQLFYTSPTGGFDFLIKICLFFGSLVAIPVIVYNFMRFISPAVPEHSTHKMGRLVTISVILALCGVAFAYYISLPAALHFLNNFTNEQIQSLISAQEYFNFVMLYMAGFALLFQMPLIMSFTDKITPLQPKTLLKKQRYIIVFSFIVAAVLTPTPDPINQLLMAAPIIILYQISIIIIWQGNQINKRKNKSSSVTNRTNLIPVAE